MFPLFSHWFFCFMCPIYGVKGLRTLIFPIRLDIFFTDCIHHPPLHLYSIITPKLLAEWTLFICCPLIFIQGFQLDLLFDPVKASLFATSPMWSWIGSEISLFFFQLPWCCYKTDKNLKLVSSTNIDGIEWKNEGSQNLIADVHYTTAFNNFAERDYVTSLVWIQLATFKPV